VSDLTAIDVLIDPDEATMERARAVNARMLQSLPQGWALDDTHQPHITTLQRYVRTADLAQVYEAVEKTPSTPRAWPSTTWATTAPPANCSRRGR
jgi:hypothetical protein